MLGQAGINTPLEPTAGSAPVIVAAGIPLNVANGVSVVIPVYNSKESLSLLVASLHPVLAKLGTPYELIFVNDGSRDESWARVQSLAEERPWIIGLNLMRNYGQHNAVLCGIRAARFSIVVTMDDDLQNPPTEIPALLARLAEDNDVVYGTPRSEQHGLWRDLASKITKWALQSATGADVARKVSSFRAFRTSLRDAFTDYKSPFISIDVLLTWGTTRFAAIPVEHSTRQIGKSNYTFGKLVVHALNMMTGYSTAPLRLASLIGFAFTLVGMGTLGFVLYSYLMHGGSVPGFPFLACLISIFSGAQLFALGIIGEYIARMHFRSMDRPPYALRERTGSR